MLARGRRCPLLLSVSINCCRSPAGSTRARSDHFTPYAARHRAAYRRDCVTSLRLHCRNDFASNNASTTPPVAHLYANRWRGWFAAPRTSCRRTVRVSRRARVQCCVAPPKCLAASKRVAQTASGEPDPFALKPRTTALSRVFCVLGTGFALRLLIGPTWVRRGCNTKYPL